MRPKNSESNWLFKDKLKAVFNSNSTEKQPNSRNTKKDLSNKLASSNPKDNTEDWSSKESFKKKSIP